MALRDQAAWIYYRLGPRSPFSRSSHSPSEVNCFFGLKFAIRILFSCVGLLAAGPAARGMSPPDWAYPVNPVEAAPPVTADGTLKHVPMSDRGFTEAQITAKFAPPDWHPEEHPPMPGIVGRARDPNGYACAYCHLPNGAGRPENAGLAGLTPHYIEAQLLAFRRGDRPGSEPRRAPQTHMISLSLGLTAAEMAEAAGYFSKLKPAMYVKVVETATVPRTVVSAWMLAAAPGSGVEPIGNRIVELAEDFARFELRDSRGTYIAYVPVGSRERGAHLVSSGGGGRTLACVACHGVDLKGMGDVPRLVGRSPSYLFRQLYDLRNGTRKGPGSELMKPVVSSLTDEDMIAISAYLASLSS